MASEQSKDYSEMTEDELNAELDAMIGDSKRSGRPFKQLGERATQLDRTVPISIRVPSRLLQRLRDEASRRQLPYQRLMLNLVESGLDTEEGRIPPTTVTVPVDAQALRSGHIRLEVVARAERRRSS
ncbi:MAG: hypothetical protein ACRDHX_08455 [Chloroflexota bacterium]